jgi:hypothetical protein
LLIDWLDGWMATLAIYTLNVIHPGVLLKIDDPTAYTSDEFEEASAMHLKVYDIVNPKIFKSNYSSFQE